MLFSLSSFLEVKLTYMLFAYTVSVILRITSNSFNFFKEPMEDSRCAVVTGGNKGIGFEICRQLALNGIQVILTARNESQGIAATKKLNDSGITNVIFRQLDIKDLDSIALLVNFVETRFKKLDILVNNAAVIGLRYDGDDLLINDGKRRVVDEKGDLLPNIFVESYEMGEECLKTNYYGTKNISEALVPLLQKSNSPRIVNVTSAYGNLSFIPNKKLKEELYDLESLSDERIDEIVKWFLRDFKAAKLRDNAWPVTASAYKLSKAIINAYTRKMSKKFKNILVNCVHPGYVDTDMSFHTGIETSEEGARGPVMVALLPDGGPSGVYFDKTTIAPFD